MNCFTLVLDPVPEAAREARDLVAKAFADCGLESYDARLVVTELFSNAARASGEGQQVVVRVRPERRLVEVQDQSDEPVTPRSVGGLDDEDGRGLLVIDELAAEWGVRALGGGGKVVWAALPT